MKKVDLIIRNAKQLLTLKSDSPKTGKEMQNLGIIQDGAVAVLNDKVANIGITDEILKEYYSENIINATEKVVMPGFVDPHTHPIFVKTREDEFEMRILGKSYKEISQSGGGIRASIKGVRNASKEELVELGFKRIKKMLEQGTTTIEAKSGYGLSMDSEIKMLEAIFDINKISKIDIIPTFLGAHEFPDEYKNTPEEYTKILIKEMLPEIKKRNLAQYCDIFCEEHVFNIEQSRRILIEAKKLDFKIRMHADELEPIGGAELSAEIGAVSADHLVAVSDIGINNMKEANVTPVLLPGTTFSLGLEKYAPARKMIDTGLPIALATDFNPGSCHCDSMQTVISLACIEMGLLPSEAIAASTINAAYSLELGNKIGSIEVNKQADILIMDIPSYKYLPYHLGSNCVYMIIKKGKLLKFPYV